MQSDIDTLRAENERLRAALAGLRDAAESDHRFSFHDLKCELYDMKGCNCGYSKSAEAYCIALDNADAVLGESK